MVAAVSALEIETLSRFKKSSKAYGFNLPLWMLLLFNTGILYLITVG